MSFQGCFGPFRGAMAKYLREANISHVLSVHPFDRPPVKERRNFHWTDFREFIYLEFFTVHPHFTIVRKI